MLHRLRSVARIVRRDGASASGAYPIGFHTASLTGGPLCEASGSMDDRSIGAEIERYVGP